MSRREHRVDPKLLQFAREMRRESAPAEALLWSCLRNRQLNGFKFRRQYAIAGYIADFCCPECRLIVELDGDSHSERQAHDERRTESLMVLGFEVVRVPNTDVFDSLEAVLEKILERCEEHKRAQGSGPSPRLSPGYRGEE